MDFHALGSAASATDDTDRAFGEIENVCKERDKGIVGGALDGRRGELHQQRR